MCLLLGPLPSWCHAAGSRRSIARARSRTSPAPNLRRAAAARPDDPTRGSAIDAEHRLPIPKGIGNRCWSSSPKPREDRRPLPGIVSRAPRDRRPLPRSTSCTPRASTNDSPLRPPCPNGLDERQPTAPALPPEDLRPSRAAFVGPLGVRGPQPTLGSGSLRGSRSPHPKRLRAKVPDHLVHRTASPPSLARMTIKEPLHDRADPSPIEPLVILLHRHL